MDTIELKNYRDDGRTTVMQESTNESILERVVKELEKIPEEIQTRYGIEINKEVLYIHRPSCVCMNFTGDIGVIENGIVFEIRSSKFIVTIWKDSLITHTIIF